MLPSPASRPGRKSASIGLSALLPGVCMGGWLAVRPDTGDDMTSSRPVELTCASRDSWQRREAAEESRYIYEKEMERYVAEQLIQWLIVANDSFFL